VRTLRFELEAIGGRQTERDRLGAHGPGRGRPEEERDACADGQADKLFGFGHGFASRKVKTMPMLQILAKIAQTFSSEVCDKIAKFLVRIFKRNRSKF
jgi:hypothetical protein